jgi:hypothetical protein
METAQHWDRLAKNQPAEIVMFQISEVQESPAFNGRLSFLTLRDRDKVWQPSSVEEQSRRTVYAFVRRSLIVPLLEVLDLCDTTRSTERRNITSVAPQALTLFNGKFINQQASHLAERVIDEAGGAPTAQVTHAWRIALCRRPTESGQWSNS